MTGRFGLLYNFQPSLNTSCIIMEQNKYVVCDVCKEQFSDVATFLEHKKNTDTFVCGLCTARFHVYEDFSLHKSNHAGTVVGHDSDHPSVNMDQSSSTNAGVDDGHQSDTELSVVMCKLCGQYAISKSQMWKHLTTEHGVFYDDTAESLVMSCLEQVKGASTVIESPLHNVVQKRRRGRPPKKPPAAEGACTPSDMRNPLSGKEKLDDSCQDNSVKLSSSVSPGSENPTSEPPTKRRRGRPTRAEALAKRQAQAEQDRPVKPPPLSEDKELPAEVRRMGDKLQCIRCTKSFARLRQVHGHRCIKRESDFIEYFPERANAIAQLEADDDDKEDEPAPTAELNAEDNSDELSANDDDYRPPSHVKVVYSRRGTPIATRVAPVDPTSIDADSKPFPLTETGSSGGDADTIWSNTWKTIVESGEETSLLDESEHGQGEDSADDDGQVKMILQEDTGMWVVVDMTGEGVPLEEKVGEVEKEAAVEDAPTETPTVDTDTVATEEALEGQQLLQEEVVAPDNRPSSTTPVATAVQPKSEKEEPLPVFSTEAERLEFEEHLQKTIDYTEVDKLYEPYKFQQTVDSDLFKNEEMKKYRDLFVYNCRVCKKVFNSVKNVRLHCFTHTQFKPFTCSQEQCDYASNRKSSVLAHMRKHTGNLFTCKLCEFKSLSRLSLEAHVQKHAEPCLSKCKLCNDDSSYSSKELLRDHVLKHHVTTNDGRRYLQILDNKPKLSPYARKRRKGKHKIHVHQCDICLFRCKSKSDLTRHLAVHKIRSVNSMLCELCDFVSARAEYLLKHYKTHRILYLCSVCNTKILSATSLLAHLREHATDDQEELNSLYVNSINSSIYLPEPDGSIATFQCGAGGKVVGLDSSGVLDALRTDHADEELNHPLLQKDSIYSICKYRPLTVEVFNKIQETFGAIECMYCGRRFHRQGDYTEHVNVHTREKVYECEHDGCAFQALSKDNMRRHVEKVHEKKQYVCELCAHVSNSRMKAWHHKQDAHAGIIDVTCPGCSVRFTKARKLRGHIARVHPNMDRDIVLQLTGQQLKIHGKLGRRSFKCKYCKKVFVNARDLEKHTWIHEGLRPYKCDKCSYTCRSANNLKVHQLKHSKEKTQLCEECGKKYKSVTALNWHIRSHELGRIFKCDKCDYTAVQKSHLKRHMETHSGVRRYRCSECDYTTNTVASMKVHYSRIHKGLSYNTPILNQAELPPDQKVYKCSSCDFLFCNLPDLKRHLNSRHHGPWLPNLSELHLQEITTPDGTTTLVQVVEIQSSADGAATVAPSEMDETTSSAATILQQIIEQSNSHQVELHPVVDENMESLVVNADGADTIILQESEEVVIGEDFGQYIIQYVTEDGTVLHTEVPASEVPQ
ncbi:PREDICTED: zinc finger protein ZFAT-like isoform X3 [Priapulus caudatus]|uniref:Zinc finger protein ZFAT-like isoform X3 n=1 Tax=Priapulus caudatus TaxID=37621 RepID=A0ABM1F9C4_PRICU|nr:PREDICTED: zinc finger protein ZFAT-like isoform X3 [Priapulus caudatus]